jgi:hypothetical protein
VVAAAGVAWGVLNAEESVSIWFIPMRGIHIAMLCVAYLVFTYARVPVLLPFALLPCAASYLWVRNRAWGSFGYIRPAVRTPRLRLVPSNPARTNRPKDDRFTFRDLNPFEWFARRRRQKQFERLMRDD